MTALIKAPVIGPNDSLSAYLTEIRQVPMLDAEEEYTLAKAWKEHKDREAAHRLVTSHLRLVAKIAMGYRGYGLPVAELVSEGNVGMMQAVKKFDPDKGFRLATYAMWWIKASIQEYVLHSWSMVKIGTTAAQKKLFFNLRKVKGEIKAYEDGDLTPENTKLIADRLNVTEKEVTEMNRRMSAGDNSLNAPMRKDGDSGEWIDFLDDQEMFNQEEFVIEQDELSKKRELLQEALSDLSEREQHILTERRLQDKPTTLEELSQIYSISRERVRQIEARAYEKLEEAMLKAACHNKLLPQCQ